MLKKTKILLNKKFTILAILLILLSQSVIAATYTNTASGNWSDAGNWTGGIIPPTGGATTDSIIFTNSITTTNNLTGTFTNNSWLSYQNTILSGNPMNISGDSPTINCVSNLLIYNNLSGTNFIKLGNGTLIIAGTNTFAGTITNNAGNLQVGTNSAFTSLGLNSFTLISGSQLTFSKNIDNCAFTVQSINGTGDVYFIGNTNGYYTFRSSGPAYSGTWNNYGQVIVNTEFAPGGAGWYQGTLWLEKDSVISRNAILNIQKGKVYTRNQTSSGIIITGLVGNANTWISTDAAVANKQKWTITPASGSNYVYSGVIGSDGTGTGNNNESLTINGGGTQTLAGANTYVGNTTISAGTLQLGNGVTDGTISNSPLLSNSGTLIHNCLGSIVYTGVVSGAGNILKTGAGTLTYSAINTTTGSLIVTNGTMIINGEINSTNIVVGTNSLLVVSNAGVNVLSDSSALYLTNDSVTAGKVFLSSGTVETNGSLYFNGIQQYPGTWGSSSSSAPMTNDNYFSGSGVLVTTSSGAFNYTNIASGNWSSKNSWMANAVPLSGGNESQTIVIDGASSIDATNDINGTMTNTLVYFQQSSKLSGGTLGFPNLSGISLCALASKTGVVANSSIVSLNQFYINDPAGYSGTIYLSNITWTASGGFFGIKQGKIILDNATIGRPSGYRWGDNISPFNTETIITNNSVLSASGANNFNFGFNQAAVINTMDISSGSIINYTNNGVIRFYNNANENNSMRLGSSAIMRCQNILGFNLSFNGLQKFYWDGGIVQVVSNGSNFSSTFFSWIDYVYVNNGGAIFDSTNFNITINQPLLSNGTGGLIKLGSGTLTLGGTNTYTGNTVISNGILKISSSGSLGSGLYDGNISNNNEFIYNSTVTQTLGGVISGTGSVAITSSGKLILTNANTYSGSTIVTNGILSITLTNCLSGNTSVYIYTGATNNLNFTGTNVINSLYVNNTLQPVGLYSTNNLPTYITGAGYLQTLFGSAPISTIQYLIPTETNTLFEQNILAQ